MNTCLSILAIALYTIPAQATELPDNLPLPNKAGAAATYSTRGVVDFTPFHQPLGTNGCCSRARLMH